MLPTSFAAISSPSKVLTTDWTFFNATLDFRDLWIPLLFSLGEYRNAPSFILWVIPRGIFEWNDPSHFFELFSCLSEVFVCDDFWLSELFFPNRLENFQKLAIVHLGWIATIQFANDAISRCEAHESLCRFVFLVWPIMVFLCDISFLYHRKVCGIHLEVYSS